MPTINWITIVLFILNLAAAGPSQGRLTAASIADYGEHSNINGSSDARFNAQENELNFKSDFPLPIQPNNSYIKFEWPLIIKGTDTYSQWIMAFLSLFSTIISFFALIYLIRTLKYTRDAVSHAESSSKAAFYAVSITEKSAEKQLRPYLYITAESWKYDPPIRQDTSIFFIVRNSGHTPAYNINFYGGWLATTLPLKPGEKSPTLPFDRIDSLPPNGDERLDMQAGTFPGFKGAINDGAAVCLRITVTYEWTSFSGNRSYDNCDIEVVFDPSDRKGHFYRKSQSHYN
ncbi:hypothetical protein [Afifella sp. YEN Y35]|uniref:hypothetical protein n=1 Tax=Afifella sp. YEN Y35 TaxID=3388337 RepID=UPI0039E151D0